MPSSSLYINNIVLDSQSYVWGSGQDIRKFNGSSWDYYNSSNSAVPPCNGGTAYLDTRSLSINPSGILWVGVAQGMTAGVNEVAVFSLNSRDVNEGESWNFDEIADFSGVKQEVSTIYACPYGDDVYAFISPLNGVGGTSGASNYTKFNGVTGGRLFSYSEQIAEWNEVSEGYTWPHIYQILAKGEGGNKYYYYLASEEGLIKIPQGTLSQTALNTGNKIITQAEIYNTNTSGIISDKVYCLDADEDGNIWIGTDNGISYFDGLRFWNTPTDGPVTSIKSRPNGHVFYAIGDGELMQGEGIWHYNGITKTLFDTSNSSIQNDNVLAIELINQNIDQSGLVVHENSLWILSYNYLDAFDYDIPHVYGSSKYEGATGWNFAYYTGTGGTASPSPKVNKYTWTYPDWMVYSEENIAYKHPGLDPRNLFLTVPLEKIASGEAGKIDYWRNSPIPSYEDQILSEKISAPKWSNITSEQTYGGDLQSDSKFNVTCSTTLEVNGSTKFYVGGYITGYTEVLIGSKNSEDPVYLKNQNPTIGGEAIDLNYSSYDYCKMGFVICYNESGYVESYVPILGYSTTLDSISPSPDNNSVIVTGSYDHAIENGPYVWNGWAGYNGTTNGGPTGAPFGLTNINTPGATDGTYNWLYTAGTTGTNFFDDYYGTPLTPIDYQNGNQINSGEIQFIGGTEFENVNRISLNYLDYNGNDLLSGFSYLPTNYCLFVEDSTSPGNLLAKYVINSVSIDKDGIYPDGGNGGTPVIVMDVTYQYPKISASSISSYTDFGLTIYSYESTCFPLINSLNYLKNEIEGGNSAIGLYCAEIEKDLGSITSFRGITGDYNRNISKSYRVKNFRTFPSELDGVANPNYPYSNSTDYINSKSDTNNNLVSIGVLQDYVSIGNSLITFKNLWNRSDDSYESLDNLGDNTSRNSISLLQLDRSDFSLAYTLNSSLSDPSYYSKNLNSVNSINNGSTVLFTGNSSGNFNIGGISLTGASGPSPYFIMFDDCGKGITGYFLIDGMTGNHTIISTKDEASYYVSTFFGGTGSYFGETFYPGQTGANILSCELTEQGTSKKMTPTNLETDSSNVQDLLSVNKMSNGSLFFMYSNYSFPKLNIIKSAEGRITDSNNFFNLSPVFDNVTSSVSGSDVYMAGTNRLNGTGGTGYINVGNWKSFFLESELYEPPIGVNMGRILSRPGSGAWTWCDVHFSDNYLEIPLMSTLFISNYASNLYGKTNNKWSLINSEDNNDLLTIKNSPYFIYTFNTPGYYTITNSVEDSFGNVYEVSRPGFIKVMDHKIKRPDDTKPDYVDSTDYGYPEPFFGRDYEAKKLEREMKKDEIQIIQDGIRPFGPEIVLPDDPDATFGLND